MRLKDKNIADSQFVIEVKNVFKSFKTVEAVKDVTLRIGQGEFVALLGPNGAGKTTLVEMIEGIQQPDRGEIYIMGRKWKGHEDELHQIIGISLQETRFIDKLTVEETLKLFSVFYDLPSSRVDEVVDLIDLKDKKNSYTLHLSGGQRQKLALGISLLNKPKILLLDEPTTGLDPNARREIWDILSMLKKESGTSLILTTHYMDEAEKICDYVIIIDKGKIIREGSIGDLIRNDGGSIIEFSLKKNEQLHNLILHDAPFDIDWSDDTNKGILKLKDFETELPEFLSFLKSKNISLINFESRRKTLDDLFTSLTGRHLNEQNY